jgi:hypothetical protein
VGDGQRRPVGSCEADAGAGAEDITRAGSCRRTGRPRGVTLVLHAFSHSVYPVARSLHAVAQRANIRLLVQADAP